jgi:hypothetical protein
MAPEPIRTPALRLLSATLFLSALALATPAHALRVVAFNILNYPGTTAATRNPFYRTILAPLSADVLSTEEMVSQTGCDQFLANLNVMDPGQWAYSAFQDGGDTASELFYKPAKVQLIGQWAFYPNPANLLRFVHVFRLRPVGYNSSAAEFRIYSLHLKASMGFEAQRLAEATGLRDSLNAMPPGTHALITGDFNFYTGLEPGMQKLVESQVNNIGQLYDPLGLQNVTWQDNTSMQLAWTQSPCKTGDTGCASGASTGGMDDRFDLILPSNPFRDGAGLELVPGSYISVGNDGLHHNNSIQDPPTIPEGAAYATALHSVSDHLPVRVDLRLPALVSVSGSPIAFGSVIVGATAGTLVDVSNAATVPGEPLNYFYNAPAGFTTPGGTHTAAPGVTNHDAVGLDTSAPGAAAGSLLLSSNSADNPSVNIALSGTVLRHADASLDSLADLAAGTLDFGTHVAGEFTSLAVRVHNRGYDALQARLNLTSASISGGAGRFSVTGATPQLLAGTGATFDVAFDDAGATSDSTYTATLTFVSGDEALPGATAATTLSMDLSAQLTGGGTTGVGDHAPTVTLLRAPVPNPLAGSSLLNFELAQGGDTRRVASLLHTGLEPGRYSVRWNGRTDDGSALGAGLYFARLSAAGAKPHAVRLAIVR